ncbi:MAG: hypothetical protein A2096_11010 [Spirochaetes bacterium GWF1_41_5]|nr:MAG: hypothetical protein A2096_11010 [Spirochaetes bacterium GWF1_41_5]HBE01745.1 hypothetical protein [Spirochaetia bacterium]
MKIKLIYLILIFFIIFSCQKKKARELLTAGISRGPFVETLSVSGLLEAAESVDVNSPGFDRQFILIHLIPEGTYVNKGDLIARFDTGDIDEQIKKLEEQIETQRNDIENFQANIRENMIGLSNQLSEKINTLDIEIAGQSALQFAPKVDQLKGELQLSRRYMDVSNAEIKIRTTANNDTMALRIKNNNYAKVCRDRDEYLRRREFYNVYAPTRGLIVYQPKGPWTREKIRVGDQIRRGFTYIIIPDLEKMRVKIEINEIDVNRIRKKMACGIILDAFPEKKFTAELASIGALAHAKHNNNEIMVFDALANIKEVDTDVLRPGMTARVDIILSYLPDARYIPVDTVFSTDRRTGKIYINTGGKPAARMVSLGERNSDYIVIKDELPPDTQLLLYDPAIEETEFKIDEYKIIKKEQMNDKTVINAISEVSNRENSEESAVPPVKTKIKPSKPDKEPITAGAPKEDNGTKTQDAHEKIKSAKPFSLNALKTEKPELYEKIKKFLAEKKLDEKVLQDAEKRREIMRELGIGRQRSATGAAAEKK